MDTNTFFTKGQQVRWVGTEKDHGWNFGQIGRIVELGVKKPDGWCTLDVLPIDSDMPVRICYPHELEPWPDR